MKIAEIKKLKKMKDFLNTARLAVEKQLSKNILVDDVFYIFTYKNKPVYVNLWLDTFSGNNGSKVFYLTAYQSHIDKQKRLLIDYSKEVRLLKFKPDALTVKFK